MNIFETSYTEYLRAKKSGLRREAMTALNTFLAACGNVDTVSKRQIIKDFFTRQSAEDIEIACFRGFDHFQAGRIRVFKSGGWRMSVQNLF